MCKRTIKDSRRAQTISEYVILISLITMAAIVMFPLTKRGIQSLVKVGADQIGEQINSEQDYTSDTGHLIDATTTTSGGQDDWTIYRPGSVEERVVASTTTNTTSYTNSGFTEE